MRILASAIVILSGGLCVGLSQQGTKGINDGLPVGVFVLFCGGVFFTIEFIRTWKSSTD